MNCASSFSRPAAVLRPCGFFAFCWRLTYGLLAFVTLAGTGLFAAAFFLSWQISRTFWNGDGALFLIFGLLFFFFAQYSVRKLLVWFRFRLAVCPEGLICCQALRQTCIPWEKLLSIDVFRTPVMRNGFQARTELEALRVLAEDSRFSFQIHGPLVRTLRDWGRFNDALTQFWSAAQSAAPEFFEPELVPNPSFEVRTPEEMKPVFTLRPRGFWTAIRICGARLIVILFGLLLAFFALIAPATWDEKVAVAPLAVPASSPASSPISSPISSSSATSSPTSFPDSPGLLSRVLWFSVFGTLFFVIFRFLELRQLWFYARKWSQTRLFVCEAGLFFQTPGARLAFPWSELQVEVSGTSNHPIRLALLRSDGQCALLPEELLNSFGRTLPEALAFIRTRI